MKRYSSPEEFYEAEHTYAEILLKLRSILLAAKLEETIKWGTPVYTYQGKNLVGIGAFKSYAGLWFYNGSLLQDKGGVLINAQEDKTKALRQWRFSSIEEIDEQLVSAYVFESMENQKQGLAVKPNKSKPLVIPLELQNAFDQDSSLRDAFEELNLTKKREISDHVGEAKREATRLSRLEKVIPFIQQGIGIYDKYKK